MQAHLHPAERACGAAGPPSMIAPTSRGWWPRQGRGQCRSDAAAACCGGEGRGGGCVPRAACWRQAGLAVQANRSAASWAKGQRAGRPGCNGNPRHLGDTDGFGAGADESSLPWAVGKKGRRVCKGVGSGKTCLTPRRHSAARALAPPDAQSSLLNPARHPHLARSAAPTACRQTGSCPVPLLAAARPPQTRRQHSGRSAPAATAAQPCPWPRCCAAWVHLPSLAERWLPRPGRCHAPNGAHGTGAGCCLGAAAVAALAQPSRAQARSRRHRPAT